MKSISYIVLLLLLTSCFEKPNKQAKFSEKEVASLSLDSTLDILINQDSVVSVNLKPLLKDAQFNFGNLVKSVKYLPLETNSDNLISEINQIIVSDSNIYICSDQSLNSVLIFNTEGKYVSKISRGEALGEILQLKGIAYDVNLEELVVYHNKYLSFYTKNGIFKRKDRIPFNARYFALINEGYLFYAANGTDNIHLGYTDNYQILITDKLFHLTAKGFPYKLSENLNYGGNNPLSQNNSQNNSQLNICFNFVDTIYKYIDKRRIRACYTFDIGSKRIPDDLLLTGSMDEFLNVTKQNDYDYFIGEYVESENHIFVAYHNRFTTFRKDFFIDKNTRKIVGGIRLEYDTREFPCLSSPIVSKGKYYISYAQPYNIIPNLKLLENKFVSNEDIARLNQVKEDDNPVLIFYELSSF